MTTDVVIEQQETVAKSREKWIVPKREKAGYFIGSGSHYTTHTFMTTFLAAYSLMIGVPPAILATALLFLRLWDGINDTLFGYFIDRVRFKPGNNRFSRWFFSGRYLPWFRIATFIMPFANIITFTVNVNAPVWVRVLQFAIGYLIYDTAFTISAAPWGCMLTSLTSNIDERNFLQSYSVLGQGLGVLPVMILGTVLITGSFGYGGAAILFALFGFLLAAPAMFITKERIVSAPAQNGEQQYSFKEMVDFLKKNKEFLFFELGQIITGIFFTGGAYALFVAFYFFGDANISIIFSLLWLAPTILLLPFFPIIFKHINKITAIQVACGLTFASGLAMYLMGAEGAKASMGLFYALFGVNGTGIAFITIGAAMLLPDIAEMSKYRTNTEHVGIIFSIHSTVMKLIGSLVTSVSLLILGAYGWVSVTAGSFEELKALNAQGVGLQTPQALQGLWNVMFLYPALGFGLAVLVFLLVKIDRNRVKTMIRANLGELTREEAEAILAAK